VDREERPDVDRIYMTFVQATTGGGGWPMSVWLTPDLEPFFGGTYFPPEARYGHPGFASILTQIAAAWADDRGQIVDSARDMVEQLRQHTAVEAGRGGGHRSRHPGQRLLCFRRTFDSRLGGFGRRPSSRAPRSTTSCCATTRAPRTGSPRHGAADLREMAKGGMNDQLGGGFHRYSVDERWFVPHFEKMLYDQAQLAISCLEAFQITGDRSTPQPRAASSITCCAT
jgi:uncharacterized protein YyaL (SSP411 family)